MFLHTRIAVRPLQYVSLFLIKCPPPVGTPDSYLISADLSIVCSRLQDFNFSGNEFLDTLNHVFDIPIGFELVKCMERDRARSSSGTYNYPHFWDQVALMEGTMLKCMEIEVVVGNLPSFSRVSEGEGK